MRLRPVSARWFEVLVKRADLTRALERLAETGAVELEHAHAPRPAWLDELDAALEPYRRLEAEYAPWWPEPEVASAPDPSPAAARTLIKRLESWRVDANETVERLAQLAQDTHQTERWQAVLTALHEAGVEAAPLIGGVDSSVVEIGIFLVPAGADEPTPPPTPLHVPFRTQGQHGWLVIAAKGTWADHCQWAENLQGQCLATPDWLKRHARARVRQEPGAKAPDTREVLAERQIDLGARAETLREHLARLNERYDVAATIGALAHLDWFTRVLDGTEETTNLVRFAGWTAAEQPERALFEALADIPHLMDFPAPPANARVPAIFQNPPWMRPFEVFAKALGTPAFDEVDPTPLLAIIAPLMFGYMFGDVGQGLVLAGVGLLLGRRFAIARLFVTGGLSAVVFGLLYGEFFALEGVLPALWVHPLHEPLLILAVPLVGGAALLSVALVLDTVQAYWHGSWAATRGQLGLLLWYTGILAALLAPGAGLIAVLGLTLWLFADGVRHAPLRLAELVELSFQLVLNTLSFLRVGAFALAHAGLAAAVLSLAAGTGLITTIVIVVLGNLVILALEGLVVSIQTTRLILFEFFIRFYRGQGRRFVPLARPPQVQRNLSA